MQPIRRDAAVARSRDLLRGPLRLRGGGGPGGPGRLGKGVKGEKKSIYKKDKWCRIFPLFFQGRFDAKYSRDGNRYTVTLTVEEVEEDDEGDRFTLTVENRLGAENFTVEIGELDDGELPVKENIIRGLLI